jgi:hypothetical protein
MSFCFSHLPPLSKEFGNELFHFGPGGALLIDFGLVALYIYYDL